MIMNKKFTLFAASLLFSSAFSVYAAQDVKPEEMKLSHYSTDASASADDVKAGGTFFLKFGEDYLGSDWSNDDKTDVGYFIAKKDEAKLTEGKDDLNKYLWVVTPENQPGQKVAYSFQNVETKEFIRFTVDANDAFTIVTKAPESGASIENLFEVGEEGKAYAGTATQFTVAGYSSNDVLSYETDLVAQAFPTGAGMPVADNITIVDLKDGISVDVADLNDLYNSAGFNFNLTDDKLADVANIFGDKRVIALNVSSDVMKESGSEYGFPEGTYFATSVPYLWKKTTAPTYDYLTQCTFIAIDSDKNILDDADEQKKGNGFALTEISGKDLVLYMGSEDKNKSQGNQTSVYNACFTVLESTTSDKVYALSVAEARVVEASSAAKQIEKKLYITADAKTSEIYTTADGDNQYIFKFAASTVKKPIELLKEDGATIVNIRFYKKNGKDDSYNAKYLTTDAANTEFVAKGKVLADLDAPAYQWVISAVDGNNVTFKNRENGRELKTQLFDEGNGLYSLSPDPDAPLNTFTYYNLEDNGDVKVAMKDATNEDVINFQGVLVELIDSKAVNYSGYLNVEDETLMTLSFGRDIAPTSNKLYPYVTEVTTKDYKFNTAEKNTLTNEVSEAAQWLLIKDPNGARTAKYNYVYANGELVNTKNNGDIVYANAYAFQLVIDGKVAKNADDEPYYLNILTNNIDNTPHYYCVQENVDGSVSIMTSRAQSQALLLDEYTETSNTINDFTEDHFSLKNIEVESEANYVKTYLIAEAPAVSLPGNEGHYSFVSETGNYITKDENRDAFAAREESEAMYLYVTDKDAVVPSFYVTLGKGEAEGERMFLFCPEDSVDYYVATGSYDKKYQWAEEETKAIFKAAAINETRDTLTTSIKGEATLVASEANNTEEVEGGIERFKMQIVEAQDADGMYVVRQVGGDWLKSINGKLAWGSKTSAIKFEITGAEAPTANEGVSATEVKVIATDGAINIKNAAGKNVVISTILGQIVANEVLTSDNATISVPAGIAIVSVDGEEAVKVSVK